MAFEDDVKTSLSSISTMLTAFLDESKTERDERKAKLDQIADEGLDVKKALAAQKAVLEANGLTKTVSESLLEGIEKGQYDVEGALANFKAMREEILNESKSTKTNEFTNESASFGKPDNGSLDLKIKGW